MAVQRLMVLCVDVDNDLSKIAAKTPIIGREAVLDAATRLALVSPEDTDVNAIFGAIKQFDELATLHDEGVDIALVVGSERGGVEADLNIRKEVSEVVSKFRPVGVVFVSDGGEDERVVPIVQSIVPLFSLQRVTVEYSKGVEESYRVFAAYVRKGFTEPRFTRYTLGIPGLLILAFVVLASKGLSNYGAYAVAVILGATMVFRGFNVYQRFYQKFVQDWNNEPIFLIGKIFSAAVILFAIVTDIVIAQNYAQNVSAGIPLLLNDTLDYYIAAVIIYFSSIIASSYLSGQVHFWKDITAITFVLSIRAAIVSVAAALQTGQFTGATVGELSLKVFSAMVLTVAVAILSLQGEKWIKSKYKPTGQT